ncbi:LysR family transcriptional regulator [Paracoccus liaowanqingii]|uniref:LysR family transcriptional regulator n=1 Tax=Paracoccus liaowanqingii TaxID=2560053 RepID=A0A4Z1CL38_9RHOB|nr:LysR family transcriptional regulator [Paracoccus liaowanqingii]TGN56938.1 LysR family transcriptional regulator [Paracoccus liaowanqingii]
MTRQNLNDLAAFATIARTRSFTAAAAELGVSPSALSHAMRGLEERLGLRLLARTTRSVAPTEAGLALLGRLAPALAQIDAGVEALSDWRDAPEGTVRLTTFHWVASTLLSRRLPGFLTRHPGITVEVNIDDGLRDIVAMGFDAGIRLGESVERDMIAVRIGPPLRTVVVATPAYWNAHGRPAHPRDLLNHPCIGYRNLGSGTLMPWEFETDSRALRLQVRGPLICNSSDLALAAVRAGCGVGWTMEEDVTHDIATGQLEQVLDDWSQPYPGAFLYHPSRRQVPAALQVLIAYLKQ